MALIPKHVNPTTVATVLFLFAASAAGCDLEEERYRIYQKKLDDAEHERVLQENRTRILNAVRAADAGTLSDVVNVLGTESYCWRAGHSYYWYAEWPASKSLKLGDVLVWPASPSDTPVYRRKCTEQPELMKARISLFGDPTPPPEVQAATPKKKVRKKASSPADQ
jgi:hypothetical protein